jgi:hypothetical protein
MEENYKSAIHAAIMHAAGLRHLMRTSRVTEEDDDDDDDVIVTTELH